MLALKIKARLCTSALAISFISESTLRPSAALNVQSLQTNCLPIFFARFDSFFLCILALFCSQFSPSNINGAQLSMTHTFNDYSFPLKPNVPPPQSYSTSSQSMRLSPGGDYIQEQYGGGRRAKSPLVELTPTRLWSRIKATQRNVGIVKEATIQCQGSSFSPNTLTSPSAPPESAPLHPIHDNSVVGGDASSALPQGNI
ncbi:uncharacterized protein HD556DRAFT_1441219 [Suillus plorans]|uniref:Uncharacterized protein n=1 Tax=Suillus plorans TaxID=116603 RepID=A0A9P7IXU1_9AGAM|nr:uncharacterized protein HD556DRAFT_1441219 [Suillus plorans]KAG1797055.1 hypothetical protein HD556DRAFT_1441219 [Suillus plorans]